MSRKTAAGLLLALGLLFLMGCEGVAGWSPIPIGRLGITTSITSGAEIGFTLFTLERDGTGQLKIGMPLLFPVSFNLTGNQVLFVRSSDRKICRADATSNGSIINCPATVPNDVNNGVLSFLPSGDFILAHQTGDLWKFTVFDTSGAVVVSDTVNQFFLPADSYKVRRNSEGGLWYLKPYNKPEFSWTVIDGSTVARYTSGGSGIQGPVNLERTITTLVRDQLAIRDQADVTSGIVSPDGTKLAFRTKTGSSPNERHSLWVLDLATNTGNIEQLVVNAPFRVQFSFSPDSSEIVYESGEGGRSVWIAASTGSNKRKLADNASLPQWHEG